VAISGLLSRNIAGQKGEGLDIQKVERKKLPVKNTIPGKMVLQK
jgi:hypothetical protein